MGRAGEDERTMGVQRCAVGVEQQRGLHRRSRLPLASALEVRERKNVQELEVTGLSLEARLRGGRGLVPPSQLIQGVRAQRPELVALQVRSGRLRQGIQ